MVEKKNKMPKELTMAEILRHLNEIYYQLGILRGRIDKFESKINSR